jgi:dTDP-glucose 4,6-dehydratase
VNIAVTGGLGFIGSHFIELLLNETDYNILCIDKETYAANLDFKKQLQYNKRVQFLTADIGEINQLKNIDTIVHFAAESHVDNSIHGPKPFIETNIIGTFNLLELTRLNNIKKFVHVSTDEVYGSIASVDLSQECIFKETTMLDPSSVYSSSKASSDLVVKSYHKTYGVNANITRCCNNYGPRQHKEKLLPKVINNALNNIAIPVYGKGENVREWIEVTDHCRGVLRVLEAGEPGEIYNIGTDNTLSNLDLVKLVLNKLDKSESLITFVEDRKGHDFMYKIDYTKIKNKLGWQPKIDFFREGLDNTIKWYKNS